MIAGFGGCCVEHPVSRATIINVAQIVCDDLKLPLATVVSSKGFFFIVISLVAREFEIPREPDVFATRRTARDAGRRGEVNSGQLSLGRAPLGRHACPKRKRHARLSYRVRCKSDDRTHRVGPTS